MLPFASLTLSAVALATASLAGAASRPDLVTKSVSPGSSFRSPGTSLTVNDAVANVGDARAGASQTHYFLSEDRARGAGDVRLKGTREVPGLRAGRRSAGSAQVTVPASTDADLYRVLACADGSTAVRESSEGNNCRVADDRLLVDVPPPPANPLTVDPQLETVSSETATIGTGGGVLSATGADGTGYELRVPSGALPRAEKITMTPLSAVGGLPMSGGLVAGVALGPDGLRFGKLATLTIDPPGPAPPGPDGFAYEGDGRQTHLYPVTEGPGSMTLKLLHFSGYGVGEATSADRASMQEQVPVNQEFRQEASLGELLDQLQEGEITPDEWEDRSAHVLIKAFFQQAIPLLKKALSPQGDYFDGEFAIQACIAFDRQATLIGLQDYNDPHLGIGIRLLAQHCEAKAGRILRKFFNQAYDRCLADVNRPVQLRRMVNLAHNAQMIAFDTAEVLGADYADKIEHCRSLTPPTWNGRVTQTRRVELCPADGDGCSGFRQYRITLDLSFEAMQPNGFSTGYIEGLGNDFEVSYEQDHTGVDNSDCDFHLHEELSHTGPLGPAVPGQHDVRFDFYQEPFAAISGMVDTSDAIGQRTMTKSNCPDAGTEQSTFTISGIRFAHCPAPPRQGPPEGTRGHHQVVGNDDFIDFACHREIPTLEPETIDASGILQKLKP